MRNLNFGLVIVLSLLFGQKMSAQAPVISTKYTSAQIEQMVQSFNMEHSRDIRPSELLQQKFKQDFPGAYDIEWETAANLYEVEFEIRRADYKAYYDEQANLIMYIHDIYESDLPSLVRQKIQSEYSNYRLSDIEKVLKGTDVRYKVELERGDYEIKLIFKDDGSVINKMVDY